MTRLYLRVYLAFVAIVVGFFLVSSTLWWAFADGRGRGPLEPAAALAGLLLSEDSRDPLAARVQRVAAALDADVAIFDAERTPVAAAGGRLPPPERGRDVHHWVHGSWRERPSAALRLDGGRWVVARTHNDSRRPEHGLLFLAAFAGVMALGAYPLARGVTRRLERLSESVEALGRGDLGARAPIEGRDEVAHLAASFNRAAERIEALVASQRTLLASASHELRSPLARLQVAAELLAREESEALSPERRSDLRHQVSRDVAQLDAGIGELLLASRLDLADAAATQRRLDFLALVAEEASGCDASVEVSGPPQGAVWIRGDERSVRHLVRNLLGNALRHAAGSPVEASVELADGEALLRVADRGPGISEADRERIFEPFTRGGGAEGGLGLGLAIVRHVARHHGGDARALERPGGGSLFEVRLPADLS